MIRVLPVFVLCVLVLFARRSEGFPHVVKPGDTLASIAEAVYGRIQYEKLLVAANALDVGGGIPIVPGMRLEIPAVSYQRVKKGETWAGLADELLGAPHRSEVLAAANGSKPWLPPDDGAEILVPYNLRVITTSGDTIVSLAYKFLGDKKKAWTLDHYNGLKGKALRDGDVILVPLSDLPLSDAGKVAARKAAIGLRTEAEQHKRAAQLGVQSEIPALIADVRNGRYADAVTRGNKFLSAGELSKPQLSIIHRHLLEAYVALSATGLATAACTAWRKNDERALLDPVVLSPKILRACERSK